MAEEILKPTIEELNDEVIAQFYNAFNNAYKKEKSPLGDFLFSELKNGTRTLYNRAVRETRVFDDSFVSVLRNAFPSFMKIMRDPKKTLRYEEDMVLVEKAKKVNTESVRHLASHTHLIKNVRQDGSVIPTKVLTTFSEDEHDIYENRFIKTLIHRVIDFLEARLELMMENLESYQGDIVRYTNHIEINKTKFDVNVDIKISNDIEEKVTVAKKVMYDVQTLLDLYRSLLNTPLYKLLQRSKPVYAPIMKTNIILHNPDFKIAYNVWLYLDKNTYIGYSVDIKEHKYEDNDEVVTDLDRLTAVMLNNILYRRGADGYEFSDKKLYKTQARTKALGNYKKDFYVFDPKNIKVEQNQVSELLLLKTAEFFDQSIEDYKFSGLTHELSVKNVYEEMLKIIGTIYPMIFPKKKPQEEAEMTLDDKYEEAKDQLQVLKTIQECKIKDLNETNAQYEKAKKLVQSFEEKVRKRDAKEAEKAEANLSGEDE